MKFMLILLQNLFCRDLRTFYVEKNQSQYFVCREEIENIICAQGFKTPE